ncbi:hypothetical protein [Fodinicurvata halophila]|uniref:hypothetical protein n=1 Tax=Fodinicurvata halophila TaxID=1419723 RepID=UPI0036332561
MFENYLEDGSGGGNLRVNNSSSTEYGACSIELGDSNQINRWYLPNKTVIDASGYRSYPTFLFQDRKGIAPPTLNSVKNGNINCKKPEISQNLNFTSNAANQKSQSENDGNGTQPKPKEAEQRDVAQHLEQLDREIASLPNVSATKYTGSVDEINVVLSLIGAWNLLYEQGAELDLDPEGQQKRQRFKALLIRKQVEMFPALRDAYGPAMRRQLWEADGSARTIGSGYRTVEFVSQGFAQNANIKQIHTELHENLLMLRFTRAQYKWFKQASEYSYYTLEPPKDSDLVKWEAGGRFRLLD